MQEIVYFDSNPTVCDMLGRLFGRYGLPVVTVPSLDQTEAVLSGCEQPAVLLLDMSRNPELLPYLQSFVPKYIPDAERCFLTSVQPTALAPYLSDRLEDCFFKHVIERPFKRQDFIQFFDEIIQPFLSDPDILTQNLPIISSDSGIQQGILQTDIALLGSSRQDASSLVHNPQIPGLEVIARRDSRISRKPRGTGLPYGQAPFGTRAPHIEFSTGAIPQAANPPLLGLKPENVTQPMNAPDIDDLNALAKISRQVSSQVQDVPSSLIMLDEEDNPVRLNVLDSQTRTVFQIPWLIAWLGHGYITGEHNTMVIRKDKDILMLMAHAGRVCWMEILPDGQFVEASAFIRNYCDEIALSKSEILNRLQQGHTLGQALSETHTPELAMQLCNHQIRATVPQMMAFEDYPVHVFQNIPHEWQKYADNRPNCDIDVMGMLFEMVRSHADTILTPEAFRTMRFATRPHRSPLNHAIQLDAAESDMIAALRTPKNLQELRQAGKKNAADIVYRLFLFEFVDMVYEAPAVKA